MNCDAANNTPIYITPVSMSLTLVELASRFSSVFSSESSTLRLSASSSRCRSFAISFSCTTQHNQAPVTCMEQATRHKIGHSETFFSANLLARYRKESKPNKTNNKTRSSAIAEGPREASCHLNLANCHATVQKLLIRQVLTKWMV